MLQDAAAGSGGGLLVEGPAGIGKSTLLAAAPEGLTDWTVLRARAGQLERDWSWAVARSLLAPALEGHPAELEALFSGAAAAAKSVVAPAEANEPADEAGVTHGLVWLVHNLSQARPTLLLVDDLHWADRASVRWLAHLARSLPELAVALVVAGRPDDSPEVSVLRAEPAMGTLVPTPLSNASTAAVLRAHLGDPDPAVVSACVRQTRGNPFLVEQFAVGVVEGTVTADGRFSATDAARQVVRRVTDAGGSAVAVAEGAAVLGADASPALIAELLGFAIEDVLDALDGMVASGVLSSAEPAVFVHPLIEAALSTAMPPARRVTLHTAAARLVADVERAAAHLLSGRPMNDPRAIEILRAAADIARARGAPDQARRLLLRALAEEPEAAVAAATRADAAECALALYDLAGLEELEQVATSTSAPAEVRARAAIEASRALWYGDVTRALDLLQRTADGADPKLRATLDTERLFLQWSGGAAAVDVREEVARLDAGPAAAPTTHLLRAYAQTNAEEAVKHLRLAAPYVGAAPSASPLFDAGVVSALVWAGALAEAEAAVAALAAQAQRTGSLLRFVTACNLRAAIHFRRGALDDAAAELAAASVEGPLADHLVTSANRALLQAEQGRGAEGAAVANAIRDHVEGLRGYMAAFVAFAVGKALSVAGDRDGALAQLRLSGEVLDRHLGATAATALAQPWASVAAQMLMGKDDMEALALAEHGLAQAQATSQPRAIGVALAALGTVRDDVATLQAAVETLERTDAALELARALLAHGSSLRRRGRRSDSREPLRRAADLAVRCGSPGLVERARDELLASGARPRRVILSGVASLTPSELRIARLVAEGRSNPAIAQELFVTRKTVEKHVSEILRKLDVAGRDEVAGALERSAPVDQEA